MPSVVSMPPNITTAASEMISPGLRPPPAAAAASTLLCSAVAPSITACSICARAANAATESGSGGAIPVESCATDTSLLGLPWSPESPVTPPTMRV